MTKFLFTYLYRDAGNYKNWGELVFLNSTNMNLEDAEKQLRENMIFRDWFLASEFNIPELFFEEANDDDIIFHEFYSIEKLDNNKSVKPFGEIVDFINLLSSKA
jgi:hypothetical protein